MIDIETLDTTARACILSIGIVYFNKEGYTKTSYILPEIQKQLDAGRRVRAATLDFWMQQSAEAKKDIFNSTTVSTDYAIGQLREIDQADLIFSHDPDLDLGAIVDFYNQFADDNTVDLFHYRKKRCFRTIKNLYDPDGKLRSRKNAVEHNALDDALVQANQLMKIVEKFEIELR